MNFPLSEIDLKTNWPVAEALDWIKANKPTEEQSKELADKILGTINVTGPVDFQEKLIKRIKKASKMATGAEYFRRFLSLSRILEIEPGNESTYCEKTKKIYLSQDKGFYITLDDKFETILSKDPNTISLLHELNHYIHENSQKFNEIYKNAIQSIETMHTKYEEGTITGFLHLKKTLLGETVDQRIYDYCCENTARLELNLPIRVSHEGAFDMKKGDSFIIKAMSYGYRAYLERLMNSDTTNKETKLEIAAALVLPEKVRQFLENGDLIPSQQSFIYALLYKAPIEIIYDLVNAGAEITGIVLTNAIANHIDAAHLLLKEQNAAPTVSTLITALQYEHMDIVKQLVQAGITPTIDMFDSVSSLKGVEFLLDVGLQPSEKAVESIIKNSFQSEVLSLMVSRGVKITNQMIPFIQLVSVAEIFLDQGFIIPEGKRFNLEFAIMQSSIKLINHFIRLGAKPNAIHLCLTDNEEIINILIQAGAKPD